MNNSEHRSDSQISVDASKIPTTADTNPATYFVHSDLEKDYWDSEADWYRTKKKTYYKHLAELNQGKKVSAGRYNTRYETHMMNKDLIEALSSQLNLTHKQRNQAERNFLSLDLEELGLPAGYVAYIVCRFVVHTDEDDKRQCHPSCDFSDVPMEFARVRVSLKIQADEIQSIYGKVQQRL